MTAGSAPVIAVLNSSEDVVQMLREVLEAAGYVTVTAHVPDIKQGREDLIAFLAHHDPRVIVYDVSPPYEENWTFMRLVQSSEAARGRRFVLTTTNKRALEDQVGATETIEVIGKPYDVEMILEEVRRALEPK